MSWAATVLTLYPDMFPGPLGHSLAGKALEEEIWSLETVNIRDHATDKHASVDDTPAGGGAGMVLKPDVLKPLSQERVLQLAEGPGAVIICGRFEGIDERVIEARGLEEVSIGDYVLSGGEPAALVLLDAVIRLLPDVMGNACSGEAESFSGGLLEYPHYTRPRSWEGREIPEVLLSGDHGRIAKWRAQRSEELTQERRPDLWAAHEHTKE